MCVRCVRGRAYAGRGYACDDETRRGGRAPRDRLVVQGLRARSLLGGKSFLEGLICLYVYVLKGVEMRVKIFWCVGSMLARAEEYIVEDVAWVFLWA
jgi:hypothetical protein